MLVNILDILTDIMMSAVDNINLELWGLNVVHGFWLALVLFI